MGNTLRISHRDKNNTERDTIVLSNPSNTQADVCPRCAVYPVLLFLSVSSSWSSGPGRGAGLGSVPCLFPEPSTAPGTQQVLSKHVMDGDELVKVLPES